MALGSFPDSHPQHLGMPGMHGTVPAVYALQKSDLLITLGARFDDRVTGKLDSFAPDAKVVHADIDPAEIGKNRHADVPIVGDARHVIDELIAAVTATSAAPVSLPAVVGRAQRPARAVPAGLRRADRRHPGPAVRDRADRRAGRAGRDLRGRGRAAPDVGVPVHQVREAATWLNSGGAGTMGYAVPAAMGAKVGKPQTAVWAIDGDGCFQMTNQELATCALEGIPIKVAVINNGNLGMVRQWQTLFYQGRYSNTVLGTHKHRIPDFVKLAEALGCVGLRCESKDDVDKIIKQAMEINDAPVVIDFTVGEDAMVWPMVAAGTSNDEIMFARDIRPDFGDDEM